MGCHLLLAVGCALRGVGGKTLVEEEVLPGVSGAGKPPRRQAELWGRKLSAGYVVQLWLLGMLSGELVGQALFGRRSYPVLYLNFILLHPPLSAPNKVA